MKKTFYLNILLLLAGQVVYGQSENLKLVFIRHAEKPLKGSNLTCEGLNRSLKIPAVLVAKFGVPDFLMVPALGLGDTTKHSRMFQTIAPLAMKYNLPIATTYTEKQFTDIATDLKNRTGTTIITWEHKAIPQIIKALGYQQPLTWPDDDYDSIWIITFKNGIAMLTKDKENIVPSQNCPF